MASWVDDAADVFVGRESERDDLLAVLRRAMSGEGPLVAVVTGEAGIGKTRLLGSVLELAADDGATIVWASCRGANETGFGPWRRVARRVATSLPAGALASAMYGEMNLLRDFLDHGRAGGIAPDAPAQAPTAPPATDVPTDEIDLGLAADAVAEFRRNRLLDEFAELFRAAGDYAPLVVVLDDVHDADADAIAMLARLLRNDGPGRMMVFLAGRSGWLESNDRLNAVLADVERDRRASRVPLGALSSAEVDALAAALVSDVPTALARHLALRAGGNPLLVRQTLRLLVEGDVVGGDVARVVGRRLDLLGATTRCALVISAIAGDGCTVEVIARTLDAPADTVRDALSDAVRAGIISDPTTGRVHFVDGAVREHIADLEIPDPDGLRRRLADALEAAYAAAAGGGHNAHLAQRFADVDAERAAEFARRRGEEALSELAFGEAAAQFGWALALLVGTPGYTPAARIDLLLAQAQALFLSTDPGDQAEAHEACREAIAVSRAEGDPDRFVEAVLLHARADRSIVFGATAYGTIDTEIVELCEEALMLVGNRAPGTRARLLARLAPEYVFGDEPGYADAATAEAYLLAARAGDRWATREALFARVLALAGPTHLGERETLTGELARLAYEDGDALYVLRAQALAAGCAMERGDLGAAAGHIAAIQTDMLDHPGFGWPRYCFVAADAIRRGDWTDAERAIVDIPVVFEDTPSVGQSFAILLAGLYAAFGRLGELAPMVQVLADSYPSAPAFRVGAAFASAQGGDLVAARGAVDAILARGLDTIPQDQTWTASMAMLAMIAWTLRHVELATAVRERLVPFQEQHVVFGGLYVTWGPIGRYVGLCDIVCGAADAAIARIAAAHSEVVACDAPTLEYDTALDLAEALMCRARRDDLDRAHRLVEGVADAALAISYAAGASRADALECRISAAIAASAQPC